MLQWGLRLSTEEGPVHCDPLAASSLRFNGASVFQRRKGRGRSIRPRRCRCFNGASVFQRRKVRLRQTTSPRYSRFNGASVFQRRKEVDVVPVVGINSMLQWGLRLSTEEGRPFTEDSAQVWALQWGLRLSTEEGSPENWPALPQPKCFNGASVFQRRKAVS